MRTLLADINVTEKFFGSNTPHTSPWWTTLCGGDPRCNQGPGILISTLLPNILIFAGVIFFGLIIGGGFSMIAGAGKEENAQDKAKAQGAITYGVIGFLLVISAYFILQIIGVVLTGSGTTFTNPPPL